MSWPKVRLKDICDLQNGYAFKSSDYVDDSNTLSCRMSNIRPGGVFDIDYNARYLPDDFVEKYSQFLLKDGDVIIAMTDLADAPKILGVPTVVETEGRNVLLNQRVGKLVIKDSQRVHFPYLKLALNYPKVRSVYKRFAGGGLQINLGKNDLLSVEIPLPPFEEQKRIAAILDKADSVRRKRKQAIDLADDFLRSVFLDMFGDPVSNPKGWDVEQLKEHIEHANNGLSRRRKIEENIGDIVLRLQDVHYEGIRFGKELNRIELEEKEKSRYRLDIGDLLFIRVNGNPEYVGRSAVFEGFAEEVFHNDHLIRIKVKDSFNSRFLSYMLNLPGGKKIISSKTKTSAGQHTISQGGIESLGFIVPPIDLQNKFVEMQSKLKKQLIKQSVSFNELNHSFNSLSQKAFTGEL